MFICIVRPDSNLVSDTLDTVSTILDPSAFDAVRDTKFFLFTRANPTQSYQIVLNDQSSLSNSNFNSAYPTRFLIHGWKQNSSADLNVLGTAAYLSLDQFNVISVDWGTCAQNIDYFSVLDCVEGVGTVLAQFIDWLGVHSTASAIGNSLGAHVAGFAGKRVTGGRLESIVGLDTAKPGFSYADPTTRLASTDAVYVESVHTSNTFGFSDPIGQTAFYMNWGKQQPGCEIEDLFYACSHHRAVYFFVESLLKPLAFWATRCADYSSIKNRKCPSTGPGAAMGGERVVKNTQGIFSATTNANSPYGKGKPTV